MDARALISHLASRDIRLILDGESLIAQPASKLTDADREAIRQSKPALLARLRASTESPRERAVAPDSRHSLIEPAVRAKLEAIEAEARAKGWPAELLWSSEFWNRPRGLAAVLDPEDEIVEVNPECITILKYRRDIQRFRRHIA